MGAMCSSSAAASSSKVAPEGPAPSRATFDPTLPDILQHEYHPPINHLNPANPWLPLLTPSQLVEIHTAFKKFDKDGDGHIEPKEIRTVMRNVGVKLSDEESRKLIASVDTDGNGMIEFDEFVSIMASNMLKDGRDQEELDRAFRLFDFEDTGFVDVTLARQLLSKCGSRPLTEAEVNELLAPLQPDDQGRVTMQQFRTLMCWRVPSAKQMSGLQAAAEAYQAAGGRSSSSPGGTGAEPAPS